MNNFIDETQVVKLVFPEFSRAFHLNCTVWELRKLGEKRQWLAFSLNSAHLNKTGSLKLPEIDRFVARKKTKLAYKIDVRQFWDSLILFWNNKGFLLQGAWELYRRIKELSRKYSIQFNSGANGLHFSPFLWSYQQTINNLSNSSLNSLRL